MNITIEKIDELIERKNVSYEEAKKALEQTDGDVLEAVLIIEENEKSSEDEEKASDKKEEKSQENTLDKESFEDFIKSFFKYSLTLTKNGKSKFVIPIWLILLFSIIKFELVIIALIIAVITKHQIKFTKENS